MSEAHAITRADRIIAVILTVAVFLLSLFGTTDRPFWGDDYAAYIAEGIAIAEGRFEEQKKINFRSHPTDIRNKEVLESGELTYAWGYPLLIAAVYAIVGYDTENFDSMVWYRAISAAFFALLAGAFYLWCRSRFSREGALILAVYIGTCRVLYGSISSYYSDILFVSFSVISFFLTDRYLKAKPGKARTVLGILLGVVLFLTWELRTNGFSVALCSALAIVLDVLRQKGRTFRERSKVIFLPIAGFLIPMIVLQGFVFGPATVEGVPFCGMPVFFKNLRYAMYTLKDWIASSLIFQLKPPAGVLGTVMKLVAYAVMAVAALGFFSGMLKNEPHVALFLFGNLIGVSVLPYAIDQGGRYHYFLLPYCVLCFGYGVQLIGKIVKRCLPEVKKQCVFRRGLIILPVVLYCAVAITATVLRGPDIVSDVDSGYSVDAVLMYRTIQADTEPDCVILTQKPRILRLNTGRDCIAVANGHGAEDADYLLDIRTTYLSNTVPKELITSLDREFVCSFGNLTLYRIKRY